MKDENKKEIQQEVKPMPEVIQDSLPKPWQTRTGAGTKNKVRIGGNNYTHNQAAALVRKLSPLEKDAHIMLADLISRGNVNALKLFFEYMYGKPKQIVEVKKEGEEVEQVFIIGGKSIKL
jgi:hypothetical protein